MRTNPPTCLPVIHGRARVEHVDASNHLVHGAETHSAMYWRTCSAIKKKKLMTCSGCPWKCFRSAGSCVAIPTEQVLRWHLRIMMQP